MRRAVMVLLLALLVGLTGCGPVIEVHRDNSPAMAAEHAAHQARLTAPTETGDAEATRPAEQPTPTPAQDTVTVAFGGDVHGEPPIAGLLASGGDPLASVAARLGEADVALVNLETAVGTAGSPAPKRYTFQADPELLDALGAGGIDIVSVANNHSLDYGVEALLETIDLAAERGLAVVGGGRDAAEAYAPQYVEAQGQTVAVVGLTRVIPFPEWAATEDRPGLASAYEPGLPAALDSIAEARERADWVIVTVHWGDEGQPCPDEVQTGLARALVDAGADVVAGHHPHVLQGVQELDGAVVAYSLGNFVWYAASEAGRTTGVLTVDLRPDGPVEWRLEPAHIDDTGSPQLLSGDDPGLTGDVLDLIDERSPGGDACTGTDWP